MNFSRNLSDLCVQVGTQLTNYGWFESLNVVIICWDFNGNSILQQPWRHIYEISRRMVERGIATTVISNRINSDQPETETINGIRIRRIYHRLLVLFFRRDLLRKTIMAEKPDVIVWCGDPLTTLFLPSLRIGKPVIWSADNDFCSFEILARVSPREILFPGHRLLWQQFLSCLFPRFVLAQIANSKLISKIQVPSNQLKMSLTRIGINASKIEIIPSSIDEDYFSTIEITDLSERFRLDPDNFIITYFGSPCTLRGTDTLLYSIPRIIRKTDKITVVILSRRLSKETAELLLEEEFLRKIVKQEGIAQFVRIMPGITDKRDLKELLYVSDVVVLPFKIIFSQVPLSVLEAMAMGKTVITTDIGPLTDIIGKNRGLTVKSSDAAGLASAIAYLIEHQEESKQIGINAKEFALNMPNWDEVVSQNINLIRRVRDTSIRNLINSKLYRRLTLKVKWQIWKKGPQTEYRRIRGKIAYRLFGVREFNLTNKKSRLNLGRDAYGRDVADGLFFYVQLLIMRGLEINTVLVLGSRAKNRWDRESDVDVVVIARTLPKGLKRKWILSEAPIFMNIQPEGFTEEEFLEELGNFNITIFDSILYGKLIYDNGFWLKVIERFNEMEVTYPILRKIGDRLSVL